jgi:hypothetical protein
VAAPVTKMLRNLLKMENKLELIKKIQKPIEEIIGEPQDEIQPDLNNFPIQHLKIGEFSKEVTKVEI